jgi:iron complex outermembrane receptor protein
VALSTYDPPELRNVEGNAELAGQNVVFGWRRSFSSGSDLKIQAYFDRTDRDDLNYREIRNTFDLDIVQHIPRGRHDLTWGVGARVSPSRFFQKSPTVEFFPEHTRDTIFSGFGQESFALSSQFTAIVGAKIEHNTYSGFEIQPNARVVWSPAEQQTLWAAVTRAVRTPSRLEEGFNFSFLAAPSVPLYLRLVGDSEFDPERLIGYEAGFRTYFTERAVIAVSAFYNRYDNLLSVENRPPVVEDTPSPPHQVLALLLRNGIAAQTRGIEATGLVDLNSRWRVRTSYSFLNLNASRHEDSNDASTVNQLEGDSPQHKVVMISMFSLPRSLNLDLTYRFVSAIPNQGVPSYSTGDVRLAKRIRADLELSLVARDLLQPHHPEYGGLPGGLVQVRRSAYLKLEWSR